MYVAVICRGYAGGLSARPNGDWACYVSKDRNEAIQLAIQARAKWGDQTYYILVGKLSQMVITKADFQVVKLPKANPRRK
jgi:hypothetical protein